MDTKEATKLIDWIKDVYYCCAPKQGTKPRFIEQTEELAELLKSLELENKGYEVYSKKLVLENHAYKKMWDEIKDLLEKLYKNKTNYATPKGVVWDMEKLEQKYLGGNNG